MATAPTIDGFDPAKPADANRAPFKAVTFKDGGLTDSATLIWSGDTLLDLDRYQALKMTVKTIGGNRLPLHRGRRLQRQEPRGLEVAAVRHETERRHPVINEGHA